MTQIRPSQVKPGTGNADKFLRVNSAGTEVVLSAFGGASADAEFIRDTIGTAMVAGTGVTITVNDVGDTITVAIDTASENERLMDFLSGTTTAGKGLIAGTNITLTYDDVNDKITIAAAGGGGGSAHIIKDEGTALTARANLNFVGAGVTATDDGSANTIVTIPGGGGGFNFLGPWTSGTPYAIGDIVTAVGETWLATAAHTVGGGTTFVQRSESTPDGTSASFAAHGSATIGDTQILTIARHASYGVTPTPSGWTLVGFYTSAHSGLSLYKRAVTAGNIAATVAISWTDKGQAQMRTYNNAAAVTVEGFGTGLISPSRVVNGLLTRIVASAISNGVSSPAGSSLTADASLNNKSGPTSAAWFGFTVIGEDPTAAGSTASARTAVAPGTGADTPFPQWIDISFGSPAVWDPTGWVKIAHYDAPLTTKGDLMVRSATADSRLAVGPDGYAVVADSTQPLGVKWAPGGGGGSGGAATATTQQVFSPTAGTTVLTLLQAPAASTFRLYRNGLLLRLTTDYVLASTTVTLTASSVTGDVYTAMWETTAAAANPWVKRVDASLATGALTGWTAGAGTWTAEVDRFRQASTAAAVQRLHYNTRLNQAMIVAECDIRVDANPTTSSRAGFVFGTPFAADGGEGFLADLMAFSGGGSLITGTNFERDAVVAGPNINMTPTIPLGTWVNFRVVVAGNSASAYVNGVLVGAGSIAMVNHEIGRFALYTYAADASFKNLKIWTIATPDEALTTVRVQDRLWVPGPLETSIDEFNDGVLNTAWGRVDSAGAARCTWTEGADVLSGYNDGGDAGNELHCMMRPLTTAGGSLVAGDAFVTMITLMGPNAVYTMGGLVLADGATYGAGKQVHQLLFLGAGTISWDIRSATNYSVAGTTVGSVAWGIQKYYSRLVMLTATTWRVDLSPDGVSWIKGGVLTYTMTPTHVGMLTSSWTSATKGVTSYEFLRRVAGIT